MNNFNFFQSPTDISQELVKRVKARRKELKLSQAALSTRADVSLGSIKRFERTGEISFSSLLKIGFALGCEEDFNSLFAKKKYQSIQEVIDEQI